MDVTLILGTRPQIIKSAPIIKEVYDNPEINIDIIHTGQHYDYEMSRIFFDEMYLPDPIVDLGVGSGSHAWQTGNMLMRIEEALIEISPDLVVVPGDTNSTLAGALASSKMNIKIAHIEAGARSYDMKMPEEINRRLTDHCSDILFTVSENCSNNLIKEGISVKKIKQVGDTMYDILLQHLPKIKKSNVIKKLNLFDEKFAVLTIHRQENVNNNKNLLDIMEAIIELQNIKIVFPIHPRTKKRLIQLNYIDNIKSIGHVKLIPPLGYHDMLNLIMNSILLITDSGGMQKEAYWLKTRCITLRDTTEWIETIQASANVLVGANKSAIINEVTKAVEKRKEKNIFDNKIFGDGRAAKKVIENIINT